MRPALWLLLLLGFVPALAWAEEPKSLTPEELRKKLEEYDKYDRKIRDIERRTGPAERRIAELEDHLRQLRLKADLMEIQMKSMEEVLKAIRKDVATLAARTEIIEARPGAASAKPATPAGTAVSTLATIRSHKVSLGADVITITGVVGNSADKPLVFVVVKGEFLDKAGQIVKTESAFTEPRVIPAGSTATFAIRTVGDPRIQDYRLTVTTQ